MKIPTSNIMRTSLRNALTFSTLAAVLVLMLALAWATRSYAQAQAPPDAPVKVAALHEPPAAPDVPAKAATAPDQVSTDIAKELAAMKARIEQLEAELKARTGRPTATTNAALAPVVPAKAAAPMSLTMTAGATAQTSGDSTAMPAKKEKIAPFSDWDWTWLNGNPRNKDTAFDSKFFTPEIRADVTYSYDFNKPVDNSMGGSSELFRSTKSSWSSSASAAISITTTCVPAS